MRQRAVIYCRVSTKEQLANLSIPVQQKACMDYCVHQGMEVAKIFIEEGESAKTADRTRLKEMLAYCRKHQGTVQFLVVHMIDRLARNSYDHVIIRKHLAGLGISLRAASQPIDDTPTGKAMEGMLSVFAQLDNEVKAGRAKDGMREAAQRGQWVWRAPLGYLHASRPEGGRTLIQDPTRAHLVAKAFELVASGLHTFTDALQQVTELGLRSHRGERLILQTFKQMLANPVYAGRIVIPTWQLDVQGSFDALIDPEIWWRVRSILSGGTLRITPHERNRPDFPFRGFVYCAKCRRPLTGSWSTGNQGRKYGYYHCPSTARCRATKVRREVLEEDFIGLLAELKPEPNYLALFREVVLDVWQHRLKHVLDLRAALENELRDLKRKRDRLVDAFVFQQAITEEIYQEKMGELSEQQTMAQMRLHELHVDEIDAEAALVFSERLVSHADRMWIAASLDQRQMLQRALYPSGLAARENRLVRTAPSLLFFEVCDSFRVAEKGWCALEDSNL